MPDYQVQVAELPQVPAEELRDALRWRLGDIFGQSEEQELSFDFQLLPGQGFNPAPTQALVFAVDNLLLGRRQNWLREAGLGLTVVDTREMAQRNLSALAEADERGLAVLSLNEHGGLLTVTQHGTLYLSRRLDLSLNSLNTRDVGRRQELIERSALEIQRSLDIFDRQYSALGLSRLLVAPMPEQQEFIDELAQNLYIPVAAYDLAAYLDLTAIDNRDDPHFLACAWGALGASLRPAAGGTA
jgi:MSHA biogenesis protein MshI